MQIKNFTERRASVSSWKISSGQTYLQVESPEGEEHGGTQKKQMRNNGQFFPKTDKNNKLQDPRSQTNPKHKNYEVNYTKAHYNRIAQTQ